MEAVTLMLLEGHFTRKGKYSRFTIIASKHISPPTEKEKAKLGITEIAIIDGVRWSKWIK